MTTLLDTEDVTARVDADNEHVYWILLHSQPDNRLRTRLLAEGLLPALEAIDNATRLHSTRKYTKRKPGAVIITSDYPKFFSNGLDLVDAQKSGMDYFYGDCYYRTLSRLLTFPLPVIAAINGHCFAGAFCLALAADFRIMNQDKGFLCMNEVDFGAVIPRGFMAVLRERLPPSLHTKVLAGQRFTSRQAHAAGIIDELAPDGIKAIRRVAREFASRLAEKSTSGVYGHNKALFCRDVLPELTREAFVRDLDPVYVKEKIRPPAKL